jgi:FAD/FMN-containing dehydrogenase
MQAGGVQITQQSDPVWNRLNNSAPLAVALPTSAAQVAAIMRCASASRIKVVPRSGGHSYIGASVLRNAISIDLKRLHSIRVSSNGTRVTVGAGVRLGPLYYKLSQATGGRRTIVGPLGPGAPSVGIAGFLLGGGIGPLSRAKGLACDQLASLKMVLPNGTTVTASSGQNIDLFWASCGGGGAALGIATEFTLRTVQLPAEGFTTFTFRVPTNRAAEFLERFEEYNSDNFARSGFEFDFNLGLKAVLRADSRTKQARVDVIGSFLGPRNKAGEALPFPYAIEPVQEPWLDTVVRFASSPSIQVPSDLNDVERWSNRGEYLKYKSAFLYHYTGGPGGTLPDEFFQDLVAWVGTAAQQGKQALVALELLKGNIRRSSDATAFAHRGPTALLQYGAAWSNDSDSRDNLQRISSFQALLERRYFTSPDYPKYINYLDLQQPSLKGYFGSALPRLQNLKARYDPNKLIANPLAF